MKSKISLIALGVRDVQTSLSFYRDGVGFSTHNYTEGDLPILKGIFGRWRGIHLLI